MNVYTVLKFCAHKQRHKKCKIIVTKSNFTNFILHLSRKEDHVVKFNHNDTGLKVF